jgi:hydrogenase maturation factor
VSDCHSDHCVTCADEAVPLRVDELRADGTAVCDGVEVMTDLLGPVAVGDVLLVHAGTALQRAERPQEVPR